MPQARSVPFLPEALLIDVFDWFGKKNRAEGLAEGYSASSNRERMNE